MPAFISNVLEIQTKKPLNPELSFGAISVLTFEAVMQAVIICFAGYVVARAGLLTSAGQKVMSLINVDLFTPCLVFTKLASSLSINKLDDILIIPVFYGLSTLIAYGCSRATSRFLKLNSPETDFVTAMAVFGNSNSLPVSLTLALSYTLPDLLWDQIPDDDSDKVASRGILYLLIFQQLGQILRWSWGFNTLLRKRSAEELCTDGAMEATESSSLLDPEANIANDLDNLAHQNAKNDDPCQTENSDRFAFGVPQEDGASEYEELSHEDHYSEPHDRLIKRGVLSMKNSWQAFLSLPPIRAISSYMNPPLYAMASSIIVASVPVLQNQFFEEGTFINNTITQSVKQLGSVSIPLILIVMGSNLAPNKDTPPPSRNYKKMVFASLISRMILPSIVLLPIIAACVKYVKVSILDDPIFLLVAFLLTISPPAIQLSQITQLNNIYQSEMAGVLAWGYVVLTLPTTIFIVVASLEVLKWAT
ncbi:auxin efflux carrier [Metschnikowia bicuspidata var. bicuspidata NRRL YB-4993]|uniref:Auxin efflux carrier n=1 Tax=Metschnikowia bicuspidata var. bicuspidata NRRL YB-4993 TaxID=869754 RepID=A0A1A0H986_9ASCO|nr:auxin efflux carrier [Metschnikowia bicuspidata var. bicuspidata NRRL YB-4993]OBA20560.1 auxin efflux carrier [Metschnikowia bicuspidata var. bicuspidata NRRL YB-4993]